MLSTKVRQIKGAMHEFYAYFFNYIQPKNRIMESIICIDGVVGAGKTTLGEILANELNFHFFREPVDDNPLLDKFYHDQERYSFPIQVYFLNKRFRMLKEAEKMSACIMDRSIYGDVIFARLLMENAKMSKEEYNLYEELLYNMLEHISRPRLMVYLDITVENAIKRIKERGRDYEQIVERNYWEKLNGHYTGYFEKYNFSDLLVIDVNEVDVRKSAEDRRYVLDLIKDKLRVLETV